MKKITLDENVAEIHNSVVFDSPTSAYIQIVEALREFYSHGASLVSAEVFAPRSFEPVIAPLLDSNFPVNWILPLKEVSDNILAGAHLTAVSGVQPAYFSDGRGAKGAVYEDSDNSYCRVFGVTADDNVEEASRHTVSNINNLEGMLRKCGFAFSDVARTWFYNDDILSWYPEFNKGRTSAYGQMKVFEGLLPASTGIGAPNHFGRKCVSGAFAVRSKKGLEPGSQEFVSQLSSPLQGGATEYGSSFSRAVEIVSPKSRRVMISGTASINNKGEVVHPRNVRRQTERMWENVEALLREAGAGFEQVGQMIVYLRDMADYQVVKALFDARFPDIPKVFVLAPVCRPGWLVEMECMAVLPQQCSEYPCL